MVQIDPHNFDIPFRAWGTNNGNSVADFDFDEVEYDSVMQNGFLGDGEVDYKDFEDSPIYATINAKPEGIRVCMIGSENHDLSLGPFASVGAVGEQKEQPYVKAGQDIDASLLDPTHDCLSDLIGRQ